MNIEFCAAISPVFYMLLDSISDQVNVYGTFRNRVVVLMKSVLSVYFSVIDLKAKSDTLAAQELFMEGDHLRWKLLEASQFLNEMINEGKISDNEELQEVSSLCYLTC